MEPHKLKIKTIISALTLSLLLNTAIYAQNNNLSWERLVKQYHQTKLEQFAAQDNLDAFESYLAINPSNALAQLYTASSHCFVGRDAWMPWNKLSAANTCIDKMEAAFVNAQQQYPADSVERLNCYLTFGLTSAGLPDFFQQQDVTIASLEKAKNHPLFNLLPDALQQQVLNILADFNQ